MALFNTTAYMKCFLALLMLVPFLAVAQVRFEDLTLQQALQKATAEGKLVLIQYESEHCGQCNEVADKGMSDKQLAALLEQSFVPIKSRPYDRDRPQPAAAFNMGDGFGTLFVNQSGT